MPQIPRTRVFTRVVRIEAIARDKKSPVANLAKTDWIVLDLGKRRAIDVLS